jgi:hypothetical protein
MSAGWNISLFHYRNHGADYGRVLVGMQVPPAEKGTFKEFLKNLGYAHWERNEQPRLQDCSLAKNAMTPEQFIATWKNNALTERAGAQAILTTSANCSASTSRATRTTTASSAARGRPVAGDGWADVWKRGHFGWENKKPGRDLNAALKQLTDYALQLDNPPLLVVCDRERIVIHTAFTGYPDETARNPHRRTRRRRKSAKSQMGVHRPRKAAPGEIHRRHHRRRRRPVRPARRRHAPGAGHDNCGRRSPTSSSSACSACSPKTNNCSRPASSPPPRQRRRDADKAARRIEKLFTAMQKKGGDYGDHDIAWFNGGLFKTIDVPPLTADDLKRCTRRRRHGLARHRPHHLRHPLRTRPRPRRPRPARRPLHRHRHHRQTDRPARARTARRRMGARRASAADFTTPQGIAEAKKAKATYQGFLLRLNHFRVLDPACGSGNFLYLASKPCATSKSAPTSTPSNSACNRR